MWRGEKGKREEGSMGLKEKIWEGGRSEEGVTPKRKEGCHMRREGGKTDCGEEEVKVEGKCWVIIGEE